jgi:hypothetical protein
LFYRDDVRRAVTPAVIAKYTRFQLMKEDGNYRECPTQGCGEVRA